MASRILHLAVAEKIMEQVDIKDKNRFRLGCILPDACGSAASDINSHFKVSICGNSKKTYDLVKVRSIFQEEMWDDSLYLGYYLHLIQDLIFRELIYNRYQWNSKVPGNVQRLHNDYRLTNRYVIKKYGIANDVRMTDGLESEKLYSLFPFETKKYLCDMEHDFCDDCEGDIYFFTEAMADEFVSEAADACVREFHALAEGRHEIDAYGYAWPAKLVSLLETTQNTRDLGGYRTKSGTFTKDRVLLRSDVAYCPSEKDLNYLRTRGITTVIDLRGRKDVERRPSGFAGKEGFLYYNFPVNQGSGVPESVEAVPKSYMDIAAAQAMTDVFRCIANAAAGVLFHCTAGKDRTGVVSAILLCHAGVSDQDIIENYVLTKKYGKERLELIHKNFPELDMEIVTPCERFMGEFLRRFRETYGDTETYFRGIGLEEREIRAIREKLR